MTVVVKWCKQLRKLISGEFQKNICESFWQQMTIMIEYSKWVGGGCVSGEDGKKGSKKQQ